jgi:hypothetical protein
VGVDRKEIRKGLLGIPGAVGGTAAVASVWQTPRDWIGGQFAALGGAMTHPWVTVLVTLLLVAYLAAILWTFLKPRAPSAAEMHEVEADRERRSRRRKILNEGREMVAEYELQSRWDWRQMIRYNPAFANARPHLSKAYMDRIKATRTVSAGGEGLHDPLAAMFLSELDRLEREWELS